MENLSKQLLTLADALEILGINKKELRKHCIAKIGG